jgi:hypothetical protein
MGVRITHASFAAEVQSEIPQLVRIISLFRLASSPQAQEPEGQKARYLVEALGWGHAVGMQRICDPRAPKGPGISEGYLPSASGVRITGT